MVPDRPRRAKRSLVRVGHLATVVIALAATMLTACGQKGGADAGSGGGMSVSILEPADGASVSMPFTVKVQTNVPLGPIASGKHHVHVWFDDNEAAYMVVEAENVQITNLAAGSHVLHVSLRNANHSPAGADSKHTVMVGGGAPAVTVTPSPTSSGYTY